MFCTAGASRISHLFFADDSILFFKATETEAKVVSEVLKDYEKASGQAVNFFKIPYLLLPEYPFECTECNLWTSSSC